MLLVIWRFGDHLEPCRHALWGRAMSEIRRNHDRAFREGAVRIVRETGKPIARVADDLGINPGNLGTG